MKTRLTRFFAALIFVGCLLPGAPQPARSIGHAHTLSGLMVAGNTTGAAVVPAASVVLSGTPSGVQSKAGLFKKGIIRKFLYRKLKRFLPDASTPADKMANLALILGILGLLVIPLLGPVALYLGIAALEDGTTKRTEAIIGIILGALTTLLVIVALLAIVIWLGWIGL